MTPNIRMKIVEISSIPKNISLIIDYSYYEQNYQIIFKLNLNIVDQF